MPTTHHIAIPVHEVRREDVAGPNGQTVVAASGKTYEPRQVKLILPAAVGANLDFSASRGVIHCSSVVDTINITVPRNGMYYGFSLTSEIVYYVGGALGASVNCMLAEYYLGLDAGYSLSLHLPRKRWDVNFGLYSTAPTTAPVTEFATITFLNLADGR